MGVAGGRPPGSALCGGGMSFTGVLQGQRKEGSELLAVNIASELLPWTWVLSPSPELWERAQDDILES